jgi:hypothetical protein
MPTTDIRADTYWNDTGIHLIAGARYRFSVVPGVGETLKDASFTARSIAGEDWTSVAHKTGELFHGKRVDDARWFALIGTIDKEHPFVITDGGAFTAPASGHLVCYFNDVQVPVFYKNNSGWIRLDVEQVGNTDRA